MIKVVFDMLSDIMIFVTVFEVSDDISHKHDFS